MLTKRIYANEAEADLRSAWQLLTVREELTSRPQNDRGVADKFSVITFFGTFRLPNCVARVTQNPKVDPSCHNTNVFQIGTRVNVSFTRVIAFLKIKPTRGTNNSSLL